MKTTVTEVSGHGTHRRAEAFFARYHLESPGKEIFTARLSTYPGVWRRWYLAQSAQALEEE